jgi:DNA replication and repair protein RecF
MYLSQLSLIDFRSYPEVVLVLHPGVTVFVGPNGRGKTNLVEAVGYLSGLGSHRASHDAPLVRLGTDRAVVRGSVVQAGRTTLVEIEITAGKSNRARVNRVPVSRPRDVLGLVRSVLFAPEDLVLVKGDPADRRRFLDDLLVARAPRMAGVRADYDRVLKQRNVLLKSAGGALRASPGGAGSPDLRTLDVWDTHLSRAGAELLAARLELVDGLRPLVAKSYDAIADGSGQGEARLDYRSSLGSGVELSPDREALAAALLDATRRSRREEIDRGISLVGPHRDDLVLSLGPMPAKGFASQGEAWSFAIALRLASFDLMRGMGDDPILLLDDVFAELDVGRRDRLARLVGEAEQVLVTAAVAADVPQLLAGARVDLVGGELRVVR